MRAELRRYTPRHSSDPVTRLVIPDKRLIVSTDGRQVWLGKITVGELLAEAEVDAEFIKAIEHLLADQGVLQQKMHSPEFLKTVKQARRSR